MGPAYERFIELWAEVADLGRIGGLVSWDQDTKMPPKASEAHGLAQATLAGIRHEKLCAPELADTLAKAREEVESRGDEAAQLAEATRILDKVRKIPRRLTKELALARSEGHTRWVQARSQVDFSSFEPALERLVALKREEAALLAGPKGRPYDALLDDFEPGMTEAELEPLFDELRGRLSPIVRAVADSGVQVDDSPARGAFSEAQQLALGQHVATALGFDFEAGRIDLAPHPFCSGFAPTDVRLTWRYEDDDFRSALFGILHETGHGLYEQGLPAAWQRMPLGGAVSLGVHESQSRLWENLVGRSRPFWEWCLPRLHEHLPATRGVDVDGLWPALNTIQPSLIRVEADQGTYDLHIVIRFEIERALFAGELEARDLPAAWDAKYEELLGIRAPDVKDGVLQDIHWSFGGFGYFPTYTLGNLIAAQLFEAARERLGDLDDQLARGEFGPLLAWLRENVHAHGSRYSARELVERATGRPLSPEAFLRDRERNAREVYGVAV